MSPSRLAQLRAAPRRRLCSTAKGHRAQRWPLLFHELDMDRTLNASVSPGRAIPVELVVRIDTAKSYTKNTLLAFIDFTLMDLGLSIKGAAIHEKDGKRWVSMPSRSYSDAEGTHWAPIIEFDSKEARYRVNDAVVAAFERFSAGGGSER